MTRGRPILSFVVFLSLAYFAGAGVYEAKWESLDRRPVSQWWRDAKFGIFVHWGPYSVPAYSPMKGDDDFACYAEWYQGQLLITNAAVTAYHEAHFGKVPYGNFAAFSGGWKVGVIVGADRMEAPSANAFLKSLEEPTPKTLYLMLTDQPDAILPTIVSRSQRIDLPLSEGLLDDEDTEEVGEAFAAKDASALAAKLADLKDAAEDDSDVQLMRKRFYRTLMSFVRKMMLADKLPRYQAFRNVEAVEDAFRQSERSMNDEAVLSFMLDRIVFPG